LFDWTRNLIDETGTKRNRKAKEHEMPHAFNYKIVIVYKKDKILLISLCVHKVFDLFPN